MDDRDENEVGEESQIKATPAKSNDRLAEITVDQYKEVAVTILTPGLVRDPPELEWAARMMRTLLSKGVNDMEERYETLTVIAKETMDVDLPRYDELMSETQARAPIPPVPEASGSSESRREDSSQDDSKVLDSPKKPDYQDVTQGGIALSGPNSLSTGGYGIREDLPSGWVRVDDLPCGWVPVTGDTRKDQLDLFPRDMDRALAIARVSLDDRRRWHELGWLSSDVYEADTLSEPAWHEIIFVRNLARSGLSDEWITQSLEELEPPYRYHPIRTAYSFALGWVQIPPITEDGIDDFVSGYLPGWIAEKALMNDLDPLVQIHHTLSIEISSARARTRRAAIDVDEGE